MWLKRSNGVLVCKSCKVRKSADSAKIIKVCKSCKVRKSADSAKIIKVAKFANLQILQKS